MRMILNKGHRIRASDKNLVYRFSMGTLLFVFVAVILLLNTKQLMELKGLIREALIKMILGFDIALEIEEE